MDGAVFAIFFNREEFEQLEKEKRSSGYFRMEEFIRSKMGLPRKYQPSEWQFLEDFQDLKGMKDVLRLQAKTIRQLRAIRSELWAIIPPNRRRHDENSTPEDEWLPKPHTPVDAFFDE